MHVSFFRRPKFSAKKTNEKAREIENLVQARKALATMNVASLNVPLREAAFIKESLGLQDVIARIHVEGEGRKRNSRFACYGTQHKFNIPIGNLIWTESSDCRGSYFLTYITMSKCTKKPDK